MSRFQKRGRKKGGRQQKGGQQKKGLGILVNRRNPKSRWITIGDICLNLKERFYSWSHRVPQGSSLRWNNKGQIVGHYSKAKRPWFS